MELKKYKGLTIVVDYSEDKSVWFDYDRRVITHKTIHGATVEHTLPDENWGLTRIMQYIESIIDNDIYSKLI